MYYVYVLNSRINQDIYIGFTSDLDRRMQEHLLKRSEYKLVYYEAYQDEDDARDRERKLKQRGQSIRWLKERAKRSLGRTS